MKTTRNDLLPVGAPCAGLTVEVPMPAPSIAPALRPRLPLDLPLELRIFIADFLIPSSPFLAREDEPGRRFPVAGAMRNLRALSETCKELHFLVAQLRRRPERTEFFALASRVEYEFHRKSEPARQSCIQRYSIDPLFASGAAYRPRLQLLDAIQIQGALQELRGYGNQVCELPLYIRDGFAPPSGMLRAALCGCTALRRLWLRSEGMLPLELIDELSALPELKTLTLEGASLAPDFLARLAQSALAGRLRTLDMSIKELIAPDLHALAAAARDFPELRFLSISRAALTLEHCRALLSVLPSIPRLEGLYLGKNFGRLSSEGMGILLKALLEQTQLLRLGMYNLDEPKDATALFRALIEAGSLQEFAFGGPLLQDGILQPWSLLSGASSLRSLVIDGCALDDAQVKALAQALGQSDLRELHLGGQSLTNSAVRALVPALGQNKSLVCVSFEDCEMDSRQGRALGRALAACSSLLVLRMLFKKDMEGAPAALSAVINQVKKSSSLLQFDTGDVKERANLLNETLRKNRLR